MASETQREQRRRRRKKVRRLSNVRIDEVSLVDTPAVADAVWILAKRQSPAAEIASEKATPTMTAMQTKPDTQNTNTTNTTNIAKAGAAETQMGQGQHDASTETAAAPAGEGRVAPESPVAKMYDEEKRNKAAGAFIAACESIRGAVDNLNAQDLHVLAGLMEYAEMRFHGTDAMRESGLMKSLEGQKAPDFAAPPAPETAIETAPNAAELNDPHPGDAAEPPAVPDPVAAPTPCCDEPPALADDDPTDVDEPAEEESLLAKAGRIFRERKAAAEVAAAKQAEADLFKAATRLSAELAKVSERISTLQDRFDKARGKVNV